VAKHRLRPLSSMIQSRSSIGSNESTSVLGADTFFEKSAEYDLLLSNLHRLT
jgi:hypothetical protein